MVIPVTSIFVHVYTHAGIAPMVTGSRGAISKPGQAAQKNFEAKGDQ